MKLQASQAERLQVDTDKMKKKKKGKTKSSLPSSEKVCITVTYLSSEVWSFIVS